MKLDELTACLRGAEDFFRTTLKSDLAFGLGTLEFDSLIFSSVTGFTPIQGFGEGFLYVTSTDEFYANIIQAMGRELPAPMEPAVDLFVGELSGLLLAQLQQVLPGRLTPSPTRVFRQAPNDPITLPPAIYYAPLHWKHQTLYFALGVAEHHTTNGNERH